MIFENWSVIYNLIATFMNRNNRKILFIIVSIGLVLTPFCHADDYCFESAAESFGVDPEILQAISYVESRLRPAALNANTNGTVDYGHMQINSLWVSEIGLSYTLLDDPCFCTKVGAWILSGCIDKYGYNSNAISCYNSGRPLGKLSDKQRKKTEHYVRKVEKVFKILKAK